MLLNKVLEVLARAIRREKTVQTEGIAFAKFWKYVGVGYIPKAAKDEVRVEL